MIESDVSLDSDGHLQSLAIQSEYLGKKKAQTTKGITVMASHDSFNTPDKEEMKKRKISSRMSMNVQAENLEEFFNKLKRKQTRTVINLFKNSNKNDPQKVQ